MRFPSLDRRLRLAALSLLALAGCGDDLMPPPMDGGAALGVHPRFDPVAGPMPFGAVPFPDDLYLNQDGRVEVGALPGEDADPEYAASLRAGLLELDGFSVVSPVFFTFDGRLDPSSLPASPADAMLEDASVFVVDVDPASPAGFARVPVEIAYAPSRDTLAIRPAVGHPLRPEGRYAAVVTRRVRDETGQPLVGDPDFVVVRDAITIPADPILARAYDEHTPVLATLATNGVAREDVVGLAVFRVQSVTRDLVDARARVYDLDVPVAAVTAVIPQGPALDAVLGMPEEDLPGLDVPGGVRHGAIGWLVQGTFSSPQMLSERPHTHGRFERDAMGRVVVKRMEDVPFTLVVPRGGDLSALPLVVFQHGIGEERSNVLGLADVLAAEGFAVVAIDAPFHGLRNEAAEPDTTSRFSGMDVPDGFGDVTGLEVVVTFAGVTDREGELVALHPFYLRDALRQAVVDLQATVRLFREGDLSAIRETPELATLGFADAKLAFIGNSLGGIIGTELLATEPEIGVGVLSVTGGSLVHIVEQSPTFNRGYLPLLFQKLGIAPASVDYANDPPRFYPELAVWQTLLDRGDAIAYADPLRERNVDVLMLMAKDDETLNNVGTEGLAGALGLPMVGDTPRYTDLATLETPIRNNATAAGEMVSRALFVHAPATHGLILERKGRSVWAHPVMAPFEAGTERAIDNPIDEALGQVLHFFESFRAGEAEIVAL